MTNQNHDHELFLKRSTEWTQHCCIHCQHYSRLSWQFSRHAGIILYTKFDAAKEEEGGSNKNKVIRFLSSRCYNKVLSHASLKSTGIDNGSPCHKQLYGAMIFRCNPRLCFAPVLEFFLPNAVFILLLAIQSSFIGCLILYLEQHCLLYVLTYSVMVECLVNTDCVHVLNVSTSMQPTAKSWSKRIRNLSKNYGSCLLRHPQTDWATLKSNH